MKKKNDCDSGAKKEREAVCYGIIINNLQILKSEHLSIYGREKKKHRENPSTSRESSLVLLTEI